MTNTQNITETITELNAYELAYRAGICTPSALDSAGGVWLKSVAASVADAIDYAVSNDDEMSREEIADDLRLDGVHELADGAVPIYNHNRWMVFVDMELWHQVDEDEMNALAGDDADMTSRAGIACYLIAAALVESLISEWADDEG